MPSPQISKKKLKAIVFTDIADFTKLSAQNEQKALDLQRKNKEHAKQIKEERKYLKGSKKKRRRKKRKK